MLANIDTSAQRAAYLRFKANLEMLTRTHRHCSLCNQTYRPSCPSLLSTASSTWASRVRCLKAVRCTMLLLEVSDRLGAFRSKTNHLPMGREKFSQGDKGSGPIHRAPFFFFLSGSLLCGWGLRSACCVPRTTVSRCTSLAHGAWVQSRGTDHVPDKGPDPETEHPYFVCLFFFVVLARTMTCSLCFLVDLRYLFGKSLHLQKGSLLFSKKLGCFPFAVGHYGSAVRLRLLRKFAQSRECSPRTPERCLRSSHP